MQRFLPILAILVFLLALAVLYGPGYYRQLHFERDVNSMLSAARAGQIGAVAAACKTDQQQAARALLEQYLPADFQQRIDRLAISSSQSEGNQLRWAIVTLRLSDEGGMALYQGKLKWVWNGKRWDWDFFASYAAPFSPSGEQRWIKLDDILPEASGM